MEGIELTNNEFNDEVNNSEEVPVMEEESIDELHEGNASFETVEVEDGDNNANLDEFG